MFVSMLITIDNNRIELEAAANRGAARQVRTESLTNKLTFIP